MRKSKLCINNTSDKNLISIVTKCLYKAISKGRWPNLENEQKTLTVTDKSRIFLKYDTFI